MSKEDIKAFGPNVVKELQYYVYRLIDPRNGETFYVGKGKDNRVFAHAHGEIDRDAKGEELNEAEVKYKRIKEIRNDGFSTEHIIHRHGMDEKTALEVEAALIDAYPGITNAVAGHNNDRGVMHTRQVIEKYQAKEMPLNKHNLMLINVNVSATENKTLYDATRFAWRLSGANANKAEYILAVQYGLVIGAYKLDKWLPATKEEFAKHGQDFTFPEEMPDRWAFYGERAPADIWKMYRRTRPPKAKRGAANPIRYFYKEK